MFCSLFDILWSGTLNLSLTDRWPIICLYGIEKKNGKKEVRNNCLKDVSNSNPVLRNRKISLILGCFKEGRLPN